MGCFSKRSENPYFVSTFMGWSVSHVKSFQVWLQWQIISSVIKECLIASSLLPQPNACLLKAFMRAIGTPWSSWLKNRETYIQVNLALCHQSYSLHDEQNPKGIEKEVMLYFMVVNCETPVEHAWFHLLPSAISTFIMTMKVRSHSPRIRLTIWMVLALAGSPHLMHSFYNHSTYNFTNTIAINLIAIPFLPLFISISRLIGGCSALHIIMPTLPSRNPPPWHLGWRFRFFCQYYQVWDYDRHYTGPHLTWCFQVLLHLLWWLYYLLSASGKHIFSHSKTISISLNNFYCQILKENAILFRSQTQVILHPWLTFLFLHLSNLQLLIIIFWLLMLSTQPAVNYLWVTMDCLHLCIHWFYHTATSYCTS